ncbi:hypothetical protein EYF80_039793 [Liparis tanakae]|uniref:Uncharacterized protein n=1 Tax=Liparis tanakae TaxID=230148 RepID=A0A4Z2GA97_9TELE|nr:hypothetical protein EYF80_039793 [Liparis tanakae]
MSRAKVSLSSVSSKIFPSSSSSSVRRLFLKLSCSSWFSSSRCSAPTSCSSSTRLRSSVSWRERETALASSSASQCFVMAGLQSTEGQRVRGSEGQRVRGAEGQRVRGFKRTSPGPHGHSARGFTVGTIQASTHSSIQFHHSTQSKQRLQWALRVEVTRPGLELEGAVNAAAGHTSCNLRLSPDWLEPNLVQLLTEERMRRATREQGSNYRRERRVTEKEAAHLAGRWFGVGV